MATVLTIHSEPHFRDALSQALGKIGHNVILAATGAEGLAIASTGKAQIVLLDSRLPDGAGLDILRRLRCWTSIPVVLLSSDRSVDACVDALDSGADDFLCKPFSVDELRARMDAALRRGDGMVHSATIEAGPLMIDLAARSLTVDGAAVRLTPIQWRLLEALAGNPGKLLTHGHLIRVVWGRTHGDEARASLRVHVQQLRAKLGDDSSSPRYIATEARGGYRWVATLPLSVTA